MLQSASIIQKEFESEECSGVRKLVETMVESSTDFLILQLQLVANYQEKIKRGNVRWLRSYEWNNSTTSAGVITQEFDHLILGLNKLLLISSFAVNIHQQL